MNRPEGLSKAHLKYVEYLEDKLNAFSSKQTKIGTLLGLKKLVDDTNDIMINGFLIDTLDDQGEKIGQKRVKLMNTESLSDKDDKIFDKTFKVIDKIDIYISKIEKYESELSPEEVEMVSEIMKGEDSVEARIFNKNG